MGTPPSSAPALLGALEDKDPAVQERAVGALQVLWPEVEIPVETLLAMLQHESPTTRSAAAMGLRRYLDDPKVTREEKVSFSGRFGRRLEGDSVHPANAHEENIWRLIGLIEGQYPRSSYPQVHSSLLAIHRAQFDSLRLSRSGAAAGEVDVATGLRQGSVARGRLPRWSADGRGARFIFLSGGLAARRRSARRTG
jgi:hypothetical protein